MKLRKIKTFKWEQYRASKKYSWKFRFLCPGFLPEQGEDVVISYTQRQWQKIQPKLTLGHLKALDATWNEYNLAV